MCLQNDTRTVDISKGTHLSDEAVYFDGDRYDRTQYFVDDNGVERGCVCLKRLCVSKCCPFGFGYDFKKKTCVNTTDVFDPPLWDDYKQLEGLKANDTFHFLFGKTSCSLELGEVRLRVGQATKTYHLTVVRMCYYI